MEVVVLLEGINSSIHGGGSAVGRDEAAAYLCQQRRLEREECSRAGLGFPVASHSVSRTTSHGLPYIFTRGGTAADRRPKTHMAEVHLKSTAGDAMEVETSSAGENAAGVAGLLRGFLAVQQRRAVAYSKLRWGFSEYMATGGEIAYQQLCGNVTAEFNDCSTQILEMVSLLSKPHVCRGDLANLLKDVQARERDKLQLTARIQVLKKAGCPSERLVNHDHCRSSSMAQHVCANLKEITEASGTEDAEADAEYDAALKEAIQGIQEAVTSINEHMEEVRYEIDALEAETVGSSLGEVEEAFLDTLSIK
ncbi:hypothetical protein ACQ4PT_050807 [Festuca glaucescens]